MNNLRLKKIVAQRKENLERIRAINQSMEDENRFLAEITNALEA